MPRLKIFIFLEVSDIDKYFAIFLKIYGDAQVAQDLEEVDSYPLCDVCIFQALKYAGKCQS